MIKQIKKILFTVSFIFLYSIRIFAAEHHTSWKGDRNNPYEEVNNNIPYFTEKDYTTTSFETYSQLDDLGRVGVCYANIGIDLMPGKGEKRGDISKVYPTGWRTGKKSNNNKYKDVEGGWIYNRSHCIGWQLTSENDNKRNLFTGTRYCNVNGMLPFENDVAGYIKRNPKNHVLYRCTPIFEKDNLVCEGVRLEAYSVEDNGEGVCFNVFCYNVQPGVEINYKTGQNELKTDETFTQEGLENTKEPVITTTTENITETILREEPSTEQETTTIKEQVKSAITTTKVLFPIIVSTMILIFVVLFTDKILKKKKKK